MGQEILKLLRIPAGKKRYLDELTIDDYVTRGVSLGTNASAISTAQLLTTDPRAAALSSLSFAYASLCTLLIKGIWCFIGDFNGYTTRCTEGSGTCRRLRNGIARSCGGWHVTAQLEYHGYWNIRIERRMYFKHERMDGGPV